MKDVEDIYFDGVSQIRMPTWSKGRVILLGDAASAVSLLAGAYVLAGELNRAGGDYCAAFANHEKRLRSFVEGKQRAAETFASSFVPKTSLGIWMRNQATRLMGLPGLAGLLLGRLVSLRDDFDLPDYCM